MRVVVFAVAAQFVLDQVAKTQELEINEGELQEHLFRRAQQSGQNPQQFIQHMVEHNHIPEMVSEVVRGKALALIVEAAKVVDESGNHVELKNLRPDGTIGDPEAEAAAAEPQFADFAGAAAEDAEAPEDAPESTEDADKA